MLSEIRNPRQIPGEARRRWFHSPEMDLIVWFEHPAGGPDSVPVAFQLCYDRHRGEKALSWKAERGFTHMAVDDGEAVPGSYKGTPLLAPGGELDRCAVGRRFAEAGKALPETIRAFVAAKLSQAADASLTMASDTAPRHRDPAAMLNEQPGPDEDLPLDADELMNLADRVDQLAPADAAWVGRLLREAMRARLHEAELLSAVPDASGGQPELEQQIAQVALDTAEWLKTLWNVGYMGAGSFPAQPRSAFPAVEVEDVLKSALFARIRQGKRPLPFPPPKHHGLPWHELVESHGETHTVDSDIVRDEQGLALAATIETCADWHIVEEVAKDREYIVQYQGKGPLYRLQLDTFSAELRREPPRWTRQIRLQEHGGLRSYTLEWPRDDGSSIPVPLRAATWERAESEAEHWIATKHPELYGQVRFERLAVEG